MSVFIPGYGKQGKYIRMNLLDKSSPLVVITFFLIYPKDNALALLNIISF
jgi:hypothetical protein